MIIVQDRYGGVYSGAKWLCFVDISLVPEEIYCSDDVCYAFWNNIRMYEDYVIESDCKIGKGNTPDEALKDFYNKWFSIST
jgi:hypothetical protein